MLKKINSKIEALDRKKELILTGIVSFLLVFGVMLGMGTITSGWHLVDDHEFLRWNYEMKFEGTSIFSIISRVSREQITYRYRPLYMVVRVLLCGLFGINSLYYSLLKAAETWLACVFLYYCGRRIGANKISSFLFAALSLTGYQSAVWWKLGTHEIQGTLFLAVGFYCMLRWLDEQKKGWAIGSILLFLIMCNYKESFILCMPFLMLYVVYYDLKDSEVFSFREVWQSIRTRFWYLLILGIIFLVVIAIIVFYVGVNDYDMVGLDASVPWKVYVEALTDSFSNDLKWYKRFGIILCAILLTYWDELKKLWKEILLTVVFLLPQFILYGQSGIGERYILPSSIGFAFFFILVIMKWKPLSGKRRIVYICAFLLLLAAHGRVALREADYYRYRGRSVTTMLESVLEMSQGEAKILSCLRPNEEGNLTMNFYMANYGCDNVYYWTEEDGTINQVWGVNSKFTEDRYVYQDFDDMDIVVMYNQEDRHWCYTPTLDLSDFTMLKCGTLDIYVRNGSGVTLADTTVEGLRINF